MVGAHGPKLIANNRAATFFNRCVHEGLLELALVAPDLTYRGFDAEERQKLTIRVPLNYEEGCSIEPYHEGRWYARCSNLEKLTAIPVTPVVRAEAELVPARSPSESSRVEPVPLPESAPAEGVEDRAEAAAAAAEIAGTQPKKRRSTRGPPPEKRDLVADEIRDDIRAERFTMREGRLFKGSRRVPQKQLTERYDCGKSTLLDALGVVWSEFLKNSDQ
jgi:hypothetical protein